jgi:hypothetical protein
MPNLCHKQGHLSAGVFRPKGVDSSNPHFYFHVSNLRPKSWEAYGNLPKSTESVILIWL